MKTFFSIQIFKKLQLTCVVVSMVSCGFLSNDTKTQTPVAQTANTDTYTVKPNYDHPKFKVLDAAFAKQEHRFEINRCEFKYNDQAFFIGDTMEEIVSIFGEPDSGKIKSADGQVISCSYTKLKLRLRFYTSNETLYSYSLRFSDYKGHEDTPYKIIKFRKVPYQLDMTMNEFTELCDLRHDKTLGHTSSAFYIIDEKDCTQEDNPRIWTYIGSTPAYDSIGGGHITVRGDFDPEVTGHT